MTEKKLTEAEIMKALEWCEMFTDNIVLSNKKGEKFTFALQSLQTIKQVLKDYNSKNAECKECGSRTSESIEKLQKQIAEKNAEIERLTINMNAFGLGMKREKERADTARAEAIKEFAERVLGLFPSDKQLTTISRYTLRRISKEMGVSL